MNNVVCRQPYLVGKKVRGTLRIVDKELTLNGLRVLRILGNLLSRTSDCPIEDVSARIRVYYLSRHGLIKHIEGYVRYDSELGGYGLLFRCDSPADNIRPIRVNDVVLITQANVSETLFAYLPLFKTKDNALRERFNYFYRFNWDLPTWEDA